MNVIGTLCIEVTISSICNASDWILSYQDFCISDVSMLLKNELSVFKKDALWKLTFSSMSYLMRVDLDSWNQNFLRQCNDNISVVRVKPTWNSNLAIDWKVSSVLLVIAIPRIGNVDSQ